MEGIPRLTNEGTTALLFSVILSLDKRGIIKQRDFIADLGEIVAMLKQRPFLSQTAAAELRKVHAWLDARQKPAH